MIEYIILLVVTVILDTIALDRLANMYISTRAGLAVMLGYGAVIIKIASIVFPAFFGLLGVSIPFFN